MEYHARLKLYFFNIYLLSAITSKLFMMGQYRDNKKKFSQMKVGYANEKIQRNSLIKVRFYSDFIFPFYSSL